MIARNNTPPVRDGEDPLSARVPSPASQSGPSRPDRGPSHDGTAWDPREDERICFPVDHSQHWESAREAAAWFCIKWTVLGFGAVLAVCGIWKLIEILF